MNSDDTDHKKEKMLICEIRVHVWLIS